MDTASALLAAEPPSLTPESEVASGPLLGMMRSPHAQSGAVASAADAMAATASRCDRELGMTKENVRDPAVKPHPPAGPSRAARVLPSCSVVDEPSKRAKKRTRDELAELVRDPRLTPPLPPSDLPLDI